MTNQPDELVEELSNYLTDITRYGNIALAVALVERSLAKIKSDSRRIAELEAENELSVKVMTRANECVKTLQAEIEVLRNELKGKREKIETLRAYIDEIKEAPE